MCLNLFGNGTVGKGWRWSGVSGGAFGGSFSGVGWFVWGLMARSVDESGGGGWRCLNFASLVVGLHLVLLPIGSADYLLVGMSSWRIFL